MRGRWLVAIVAAVVVIPIAWLAADYRRHVLGEAEERNESACFDHLKLVALGMLEYAEAHRDELPGETWPAETLVALRRTDEVWLLVCPSQPHLALGYALNQALLGRHASDLLHPAEVPMVFDSNNGPDKPWGGVEALPRVPRHVGGVQIAYADGHVQWRSANEARRELSAPIAWQTPPRGGAAF